MNRFRSFLYLSFVPLFVVAIDLFIRFSYLQLLELSLLQHFLYSFAFEWTIFFTIVWLISFSGRSRNVFVLFASAIFSGIQLLIYGHYLYFGVLPNPYSINYFIDHTSDSLSLIYSSITWYHGLVFILLTSVYVLLLRYALKGMDHLAIRIRRFVPIAFVLLVILFNNNVRFAPPSYSITPATIFSVKYALQERWFGHSFEVHHGYMRRRFTIAEHSLIKGRFNCILFITESVRQRNYSAYGYHRSTTPFLDSMIASGSVIRFRHHFSNAVSTQFSVPMMLSGNFTILKLDHPFVYDYLKKWTDVKTFFFTSQSMQRSNIDLVYNTSLDTFICQEKISHEQFNDLGVDDVDFSTTIKNIHTGRKKEKFFSIIQFNNTHFPYTVKPAGAVFVSSPDSEVIDRYDNTIREQDDLLRSYLHRFRDEGILDSTVIIFTSDHGEAFGERGHLGHLNTLYGEEVEVPMWIYLPKSFPPEKRAAVELNALTNTSHLDLFPTIMELFGIAEAVPHGKDPLGSTLFLPLIHGRTIPIVGKDMIDTKAAVIDSMKYIETVKEGKKFYEAFNIIRDGQERMNLWDRLPIAEKTAAREYLNMIDRSSTDTTIHH